jgi:hypothetical protein
MGKISTKTGKIQGVFRVVPVSKRREYGKKITIDTGGAVQAN